MSLLFPSVQTLPQTTETAMVCETIDLSLAVNYLPAVECSLKGMFLCFVLGFISPGEHLGVYTIMALLLNIDRVVSHRRIFDGNALLCTILASHAINFLRAGVTSSPFFLAPFVSIIWVACSVLLVAEPPFLTEYLAERTLLKRVLPSLVTGFGIGFLAFTPLNSEASGLKFFRSLGFLAMCVIWVYVIGVWRRNGMNDTFNQNLVAKFCPFLFVPIGFSIVFLLVCFVLLAYHVSRDTQQPPGPHVAISSATPLPRQQQQQQGPPPIPPSPRPGPMHTIQEEMMNHADDEEDLEAYFKMACQARGGGTSLSSQYTDVSGRIGSKMEV